MTEQRETRRGRLRLRHAVLALVVVACGGTVGKRTAGGESHFLEACPNDCGPGLECISGVCTRSCLIERSNCSDLAPGAMCTNQSIEPGSVAVCDLGCERDRDCDVLGRDFRCPAGFCRVSPPDNPQTMGGSGGGSGFVPFAPQCDPAVGFKSECSFDETCAQLQCGDGFSPFDANGCSRYCDVSSDCGPGERCRHTSLVVADEECPYLGSEVEGCLVEDGQCSCSITADCTRPSICVDATVYPESLDCAVETATCGQLNELQAAVRFILDSSQDAELIDQATRCKERVSTARDARLCGPNPLIPFEPQCSEPVAFTSECSFDATCEKLGCGDGFSQFDENGCTRYCETSADCGAGKRCRHTRLVLSDEECPSPGSEVEGCTIFNGTCECGITDDCVYPDICVDEIKYPASQDCAVEGASCQALADGEFRLQLFVESDSTTNAANEAQACLDAIRARQQALACAE